MTAKRDREDRRREKRRECQEGRKEAKKPNDFNKRKSCASGGKATVLEAHQADHQRRKNEAQFCRRGKGTTQKRLEFRNSWLAKKSRTEKRRAQTCSIGYRGKKQTW